MKPAPHNMPYPSWHNKPLRLTMQEIKHPALVLDAFFDFCSLPQARDRLQEWLFTSFCQEEDQFTYFKEQVERLVEASWLIFQDKSNNKKATGHRVKKNRKPTLSSGFARRYRIKNADELVHRMPLDTLKAELQIWYETALCNDGNAYDNGKRRDGLLTLCRAFPSLMEAIYFIYDRKTGSWQRKQDSPNNVHIMDISDSDCSFEAPEGQENARSISSVHTFCMQFEKHHVQAELWNMLDAVINSKRKKPHSRNPLMVYECFLCLTEIAYTGFRTRKKKGRNKASPPESRD